MRRCDGCTLCCTLTRVPELEKPVGKTCVFCDKGCTIYPERPQSCRDFKCAWLSGEMPRWMKPNRVHVMVERLSTRLVIALPEPGHEETWRTPKVMEVMEKYRKQGHAVVASDRTALVPDGHTVEEVFGAVYKIAKMAEGIS